MPYKITQSGGKFRVQKAHGPSKTFGTHSSKAKAQRQIRAIYANEKGKRRGR